MYAVIGLGNPGSKYEATRHNVGHMVIDELAARLSVSLASHKATHTHAATTRVGAAPGQDGEQLVLATCDSFMNVSGGPTKSLLSYYKVPVENLIVIHDDLDLPLGTLKLKRGGGEGGHNGLKSITSSTGSKNYIRVRVGIGRPPGRQDPADYVLRPFAKAEQSELALSISRAADAVTEILTLGLEQATMRAHTGNPQ